MNNFFRKLPLPAKLTFIGFIPFLFLCYVSFELYNERLNKQHLLDTFIERVNESTQIDKLIEELQIERRISFIYRLRKDGAAELKAQRTKTDSILAILKGSLNQDLKDFTSYTFLVDLESTRSWIDTADTSDQDVVMSFYTNAIFRLNTLNVFPVESRYYLEGAYDDLTGRQILSQLLTFYGIIRSNFYNVLYGQQHPVGTLYGLRGSYDIINTYESEFKVKAPPGAVRAYSAIVEDSVANPAFAYIDRIFGKMNFDSTYDSETWWKISGDAFSKIRRLQRELRQNVNLELSMLAEKEKARKNRTMLFLVISTILIALMITYTIHSITRILNQLKQNTQQLSLGVTGLKNNVRSNDVIGILADSIESIDRNNQELARAADAIGRGNFNVKIVPRSADDVLSNAIIQMKQNLQEFTRRLEESKSESEKLAEKYQTIFYKSPLPKWIYDSETLQFLEVNDAALRHYGYSREEFLSMNLNDIRPKEDRKWLDEHVKRGFGSFQRTWTHLKKDGSLITVEITAHPIDFNGKPARLVVVNDITERKKAEELQRVSEQTNRLIMSSSLDGIICMDKNGTITFWNRQAEKIFGWNEDEVDGRPLAETIIPERFREQHYKGLRNYLNTGQGPLLNRIIEIFAINREGKEFPVELAIVPIIQDKGVFFCGFIRDISERKKAAEMLFESEEKYRLLFENNPMPMFMISPEDLAIIDVNQAAVQHYGYEMDEFVQKNLKDITLEPVNMNMAAPGNKVFDIPFDAGETHHVIKDGSIIQVEISIQDIVLRNRPVRLVLANDITEKKKAEEKLKSSLENIRNLTEHIQNVREEERIRIAREIHDELGQQLTVLKMDISWLNKRLENSDEKIKDRVREVLEMLDITVKTVRKISSDLRPSMLDDLGLVAALEWQSQEFAKRTGIHSNFTTDIADQVISPKLATALFRIYQESLTNVARHAEATNVNATLKSRDNHLILTIIDNGKGFALYSIEKKKTLGILGMRERAEMLGGEYLIKSVPGEGTRIIVRIPLDGITESKTRK